MKKTLSSNGNRVTQICAACILLLVGTRHGMTQDRDSLIESDLDRPALTRATSASPEDFDMISGRLAKIPVSWYWAGQVEYPAYHRLFVRTICSSVNDDTILIVTFRDESGNSHTRFSDDTTNPEAGLGPTRCSFLDLGYRSAPIRYFVHVISKGRATARASVQYRLPYGPNPNPIFPNIPATNAWFDAPSNEGVRGFTQIGGTLIKVGPLGQGDFLEVQTADNGQAGGPYVGLDNVQMILFQLLDDNRDGLREEGDVAGNDGLWNNNASFSFPEAPTNDLDPFIRINNNFPNPGAPTNFVVLGKETRSTLTREGTETHVDLIRGPLDIPAGYSMFPETGGNSATSVFLRPGRYYASLQARTDRPVGSFDPNNMSTWNIAGHQLFALTEDALWFGSTSEHHDCSTAEPLGGSRRGQVNDIAFTMELLRSMDNVSWTAIVRRPIPRASLSGLNAQWTRFVVEVSADIGAWYKLTAVAPQPGVNFGARWEVTRNPDASELKLATANMLFNSREHGLNSSESEDNHYRNAADLMATRGDIRPTDPVTGATIFQVAERLDQAPFQWDADIVGLNEVTHKCTGSQAYCCGSVDDLGRANCYGQPQYYGIAERWYALADIFKGEAEARSSFDWKYVKGRGEYYTAPTGIPAESIPGNNPIFVNEHVWPTDGIYFSNRALTEAGCDVDVPDQDGTPGNYASCLLKGAPDGDDGGYWSGGSDSFDEDNYAVPVRAAVRRYGISPDRRVVVFNYHGEPIDNDERWAEMDSLITKIDSLLADSPESFTNLTDATRTSRLNSQLRIVIQGDFNIQSHKCGEHYWIVEKLRQHYGYAVDVSMATPNSVAWQLGMHDSGDAYDGPQGFPRRYQPYSDTDDTDFLSDGIIGKGWQDAPNHNGPFNPSPSVYPWWAATYKGMTPTTNKPGERHDAFILVGQGWAQDDPVLTYTIMNNQNLFNENPLHPDNRAVEMWATDCAHVAGSVLDFSAQSYAPNYALNNCGTFAGAPAIHTDHLPTSVRLRIW